MYEKQEIMMSSKISEKGVTSRKEGWRSKMRRKGQKSEAGKEGCEFVRRNTLCGFMKAVVECNNESEIAKHFEG